MQTPTYGYETRDRPAYERSIPTESIPKGGSILLLFGRRVNPARPRKPFRKAIHKSSPTGAIRSRGGRPNGSITQKCMPRGDSPIHTDLTGEGIRYCALFGGCRRPYLICLTELKGPSSPSFFGLAILPHLPMSGFALLALPSVKQAIYLALLLSLMSKRLVPRPPESGESLNVPRSLLFFGRARAKRTSIS